MAKKDTREAAHGRWRSILSAMGFTPKQLSGTHQPCPICGGTDRWRFTDYQGNGDYFCSGCGPGSGFDLLMGVNGWEFAYAAKEVDIVLGNVSDEPVFAPKVDEEKRRRDLNSLWKGAKSQEVLEEHLFRRGLMVPELRDEWLEDLRGHPGLFLAGSSDRHRGVLALIRNSKGQPISIHRTYVDEGIKKVMPPTEKMKGAAIWLGRAVGDQLVVGEGLETTLTGCAQFKCPGYAAISANNMEELIVPPHIERVIILADHDHSFTGQKAAFTLARRLDNDGKEVDVYLPKDRGKDFNDLIEPRSPSEILQYVDNGKPVAGMPGLSESCHVYSNEVDGE